MNSKTKTQTRRTKAQREARIRALIIHDLEVGLYSANGPYIGVLDVTTDQSSPSMLGVDVFGRWVGGMGKLWGAEQDIANLRTLPNWDEPLTAVADWALRYSSVRHYYEKALRRLR